MEEADEKEKGESIAICTGVEVRHRVDKSQLVEGGFGERVGRQSVGLEKRWKGERATL